MAGDIKIVIGADIKALEAGLAKAGTSINALGGTVTAANNKMSNSFAGVAKSTNILSSGLSSLGQSLLSGGIALGVTALVAGLVVLGEKLFEVSEAQKSLNEVMEGGRSEYVKATLEVNKVQRAFTDAAAGVITKEEALKVYNTTLGKTLGKTNDFNEAEDILKNGTKDYITAMTLRGAANLALAKAADKAFEAEKERAIGPRKRTILERLSVGRFGGTSKEEELQSRLNKLIEEEVFFKNLSNNLDQQASKLLAGIKKTKQGIVKEEEEEYKIKVKKARIVADGQAKSGAFVGISEVKYSKDRVIFVDEIKIAPKKIELLPNYSNIKTTAIKEAIEAKLAADLKDLQDSIAYYLENIGEEMIIGIADSLGKALASGDTKGIFSSLMQSVGAQVQELGKFLIRSAIKVEVAKKAFKKLIDHPILAVAAGVALVALGAAMKAAASKQYPGFATGVRNFGGGTALVGERGPELVSLPTGSNVHTNGMLNGMGSNSFVAEYTIRGTDLVTVLRRTNEQISRDG